LNGNLILSPAQLTSSYLHAAQSYHSYIKHAVPSLHMQHSALRVVSSSLDMHVLNLADIFELVASIARPELERQAALLAGIDSDLRIISGVKIHPEFLSSAIRRAIENGEKMRTLGDYVSNVKMLQVAETCNKTHSELSFRLSWMTRWVT
jgi:autophagy-related protein 11